MTRFLLAIFVLHFFAGVGGESSSLALAEPYAAVERGYELRFPDDEGSHPRFRTEWWYATGWLETDSGEPLGFQVTFFRSRPFAGLENPSAFAPHQIILAHAAIADPRQGQLVHAQKSAREGFGLAGAKEGTMHTWIDDWFFRRDGDVYMAKIEAEQLSMSLTLSPTQPPLVQGDRGFSRKGRDAASASYYYSVPQLAVSGNITIEGKTAKVAGTAWLDHEWSSTYLEAGASGWDWTGINLEHGAALMAFRIRNSSGDKHWAGGTLRDSTGRVRSFTPDEIDFTPLTTWRSPRTGTAYPVQWRVRAGDIELSLEPLMPDQELDATSSAGGVLYWEGAVRAYDDGVLAGKGYLELTGYDKPLRLH